MLINPGIMINGDAFEKKFGVKFRLGEWLKVWISCGGVNVHRFFFLFYNQVARYLC